LNEGVNGCKQKQQIRTDSVTGVVDALVRDRDGFKNQNLHRVSSL
jgi:hypothetical protein